MTIRPLSFSKLAFVILALTGQLSQAELVHYYTFDTDTLDDPTVFDSGVGPALNGTRTDRLMFTDGRTDVSSDQALWFDNPIWDDPSYVDFGEYDFTDNFTISTWIRPEETTDPQAIMTILSNKIGGGLRPGFTFHINSWLGSKFGNLHMETANGVSKSDGDTQGNIVTSDGATWQHVAVTVDRENAEARFFYEGDELTRGVSNRIIDDFPTERWWRLGAWAVESTTGAWMVHGAMDEVAIWDETLTPEQIKNVFNLGAPNYNIGSLQAGDANMDFQFNQIDLVQVQIAGKYLTDEAATWGEGDWDGAPGGSPENPPFGDGRFDQLDVVFAVASGVYLTGPYAAIQPDGREADGQTSLVYNAMTGELAVDAPTDTELTSINIDSTAGIFTGETAQNLGGSFDNDSDTNVFKATFGSSFGSLSFGNVAQTGLSEQFVLSDLTVIGSLAGGGDLGNVDLIYVPEPTSMVLIGLGLIVLIALRREKNERRHVRSTPTDVGAVRIGMP